MGFLNYQYTPYYGKISLTKKLVMNLSIYGFAGPGLIVFNEGTRLPAFNMGIGQRIYLFRHFAFKTDVGFYGYYGPDPTKIKVFELVPTKDLEARSQQPSFQIPYGSIRKTLWIHFNSYCGCGRFIMKHLKQKIILIVLFSLGALSAFGDLSDELESVPSSDEKVKKMKVKSISDLRNLAPFEDIAVIQKRFLPKTSRGEAGLSLISILNNKFFYLTGVSGRLGYFIREKHGLGVQAYAIAYLNKLFANRLQRPPNIITAYNPIAPRFFSWSLLQVDSCLREVFFFR